MNAGQRSAAVVALALGALLATPARAGHPHYTWELRLHERSWVNSPIQVSSARWTCDAALTACTAGYVDQAVSVNRCQEVARQAGMVRSFGVHGGPALNAQQLSQCNRVAPNRPQVKRPTGTSASQLAAHASMPRP